MKIKTNLRKRDKRLLIVAGIIMIAAWIIPLALGYNKPNNQKQNSQKQTLNTADKSLENYLVKTLRKNNKEIIQELGIETNERYMGLRGFQILDGTYNAEKARIDVRFSNFNSYLDSTFYLNKKEKVNEKENTQEIWEITNKEIDNKLIFGMQNMTLKHDFRWQAIPVGSPTEELLQVQFKNLDYVESEPGLLIFVERSNGEVTKEFINCSKEQVTNCAETEISGKTARTATFMKGVAEIILIEHEGVNYLFLIPNEILDEEKEQILNMINSAQFT